MVILLPYKRKLCNCEEKDMKKFFIHLFLFAVLIFPYHEVYSRVTSAADTTAPLPLNTPKNEQDLNNLYKEIPDLNDKAALQKYLEKRLQIVQPANLTPGEVETPRSVSIVDTNAQKQQNTLSAYEQIYQESLNRAAGNAPINEDTEISGDFYRMVPLVDETKPFVPDFPYVTIKLSDEREIMAPAEEHIAYLLTTIKLETTGIMNVTEEFILVSNNEGFPQGFFRIFPKYSFSRTGSKRRLDLNLKSVTINGEEYPYKITEIGNYLHIEPKTPLDLPTGIYTYRFNYLIDRAVWFYDNFDEFTWDITAKTLKNVVGSANAVIVLPTGNEFLAQNAIMSSRQGLNSNRVTITNLNQNTLAFADTEALGVGEDIHLFLTLSKGTLLAPDLLQRYLWTIQDYGMSIFALLTLLAIFISFKISLAQIRRNQDKTRANLKKTPAIFRLLNINSFDYRSLLSEILDLINRNIVELEKNENEAILVKKTDNLSKLSKTTKKLVEILFPNSETTLPSTNLSKLKLERAYKYLQKTVYREYNIYTIKLNRLYLIFSISMLVCGIIASSFVAINPSHTFWVILICTILMTPYLILFAINFKRKWLDIAVKIISALSVLYIASWLSIYTSAFYAALMITSIALIIYYFKLFSRRSGLLRNKIKETEEYKSYLQKNPELAATARDFNAKMPYIYAFELENKYKDIECFKLIEAYKKLFPNFVNKE